MCGLGNQESGDGGDKGASWVPPVPSERQVAGFSRIPADTLPEP